MTDINTKLVFSKHVKPPVTIDLANLISFDDKNQPVFPTITERETMPQVAGNPATSAIYHPAHSMCMMQKSSNFKIMSPGHILELPDNKDDATEKHMWRSFEDVVLAKKDMEIASIERKGKEIILKCLTEAGEEKIKIPANKDLIVDSGDKVRIGDPITAGELLGRGNPFLMIPLFFRYRRYYHSTEGRCNSLDGNSPKYAPPWSAGIGNFTCSMCPKKNKDQLQPGEQKCQFSVVVTFLGGQSLNKMYKLTLKSTALAVYSDKMFKVMKSVGYPHSVTFLLDTIEKQNSDGKKWWTWELLDVAKTPSWLIPHCIAAKEMIDKHYQEEDKQARQQAAPAPQRPAQAAAAPQGGYPPPSSEEWGSEFEDEPPF